MTEDSDRCISSESSRPGTKNPVHNDTPYPSPKSSGRSRASFVTAPVSILSDGVRGDSKGDEGRRRSFELQETGQWREVNRNLIPAHPITRSADTSQTPGSISFSTASTPAELLLGPQSLPFVFRRRHYDDPDVSPSKTVPIYVPPDKRITSMSSRPIPRIVEAEEGEIIAEPGAKEPVEHHHAPKLSSWRLEQIKYTKRARQAGEKQTPRPISSLHGPLSLPYARNPSGVDATIAGDTAYLSHVFGLRAAQNVVSTGMSDGSRTVSTGSGTISSRSASGSSLSVPKSAKYDTSISSTDSSGQKIALIRDPHQNIGIRKGGSREVSPFVDQIEQVQKKVMQGIQDNLRQSETPTDDGPQVLPGNGGVLPSRGHTGASLRSQLLGGPMLSPIPGSPVVNAGEADEGSLHRLFDKTTYGDDTLRPATENPSHGRESGRQMIPARPHGEHIDVFHHYVLPDSFDPAKHPEIFELFKQSGQYTYNGDVQVIRAPPSTPNNPHIVSKADASGNWRTKREQEDKPRKSAVVNTSPTTIAKAVLKQRIGPKSQKSPGPETMMTIDGLFEKFAENLEVDHVAQVNFSPPAVVNPATKPKRDSIVPSPTVNRYAVLQQENDIASTARPKGSPLAVSTAENMPTVAVPSPIQTGKASTETNPATSQPLGTAKSSPAAKATLAKGTPNAGKLLRKTVPRTLAENVPAMPSPTDKPKATVKRSSRKGKGKATA